MSRASPEVD